MNTDSMKTRGP